MNKMELLDNIILHENAYFFKNSNSIRLSNSFIEKLFRDCSEDKTGRFLVKAINEEVTLGSNIFKYSFCAFKLESKPTFIRESVESWKEIKTAYLLISELNDYVVISKKNISGIQKFLNKMEPIDYQILSSIFVEDQTQYEKLSLNNMSVSTQAIRHKSLEALNLQQSISALGASNYILNSIRISNGSNKITLTLNTSKINKFSKKNCLTDFLNWCLIVTQRIRSYSQQTTFLSIFAEPIDFEKSRDFLSPIAILLLLSKLNNDYEQNLLDFCELVVGEKRRQITIDTLFQAIKKFEEIQQINKEEIDDNIKFKVQNKVISDIEIKINKKSITLVSPKLKRIELIRSNGTRISMIDYLNRSNQFIVNFENEKLIYTNRKLFRDSRLLGNIDYYMKIFKPYTELINIATEKGSFSETHVKFDDNSLFGFVENKFSDDYDYLICDDLGNEWADHIAISDEKINYYHSKYKDSNFSASAFQDVIGQALKNIGNMTPQGYQFHCKIKKWSSFYKNDLILTKIKRLRKGDNVRASIEQFMMTLNNPNFQREINIVINFISKSSLTDRLNKLRNNESFRERNEVIQILWFISSLVSSCSEAGIQVFVCCKP